MVFICLHYPERNFQYKNRKKIMKKYLIYASAGLVLIGAGLSMAIDAGFARASGDDWVIYGTAALIVFNSGICIFGRAVVEQIREMKNG
jgi:hypothetical protein